MTEKPSVTAPKAETPTSATPPDALPTPCVMSLACSLKVSSESLPPLTKLPRSLCLASSTISGRSSLNPRTAPPIACASTSTTAAMTSTIPSTSTVEHSARLQRKRRSIAATTGERTATLKIGDEDDEKDVRDRRQRPSDGDSAGDQQHRPDRYRDLDLGAIGAARPRGGLCRGHLRVHSARSG